LGARRYRTGKQTAQREQSDRSSGPPLFSPSPFFLSFLFFFVKTSVGPGGFARAGEEGPPNPTGCFVSPPLFPPFFFFFFLSSAWGADEEGWGIDWTKEKWGLNLPSFFFPPPPYSDDIAAFSAGHRNPDGWRSPWDGALLEFLFFSPFSSPIDEIRHIAGRFRGPLT